MNEVLRIDRNSVTGSNHGRAAKKSQQTAEILYEQFSHSLMDFEQVIDA